MRWIWIVWLTKLGKYLLFIEFDFLWGHTCVRLTIQASWIHWLGYQRFFWFSSTKRIFPFPALIIPHWQYYFLLQHSVFPAQTRNVSRVWCDDPYVCSIDKRNKSRDGLDSWDWDRPGWSFNRSVKPRDRIGSWYGTAGGMTTAWNLFLLLIWHYLYMWKMDLLEFNF